MTFDTSQTRRARHGLRHLPYGTTHAPTHRLPPAVPKARSTLPEGHGIPRHPLPIYETDAPLDDVERQCLCRIHLSKVYIQCAPLLYDKPVLWHSKKQSTIALSSRESEYIAGSLALQHDLWIRCLLDSLYITPKSAATPLLMKKMSSIKGAPHQGKAHLRKHIGFHHQHLIHHTHSNSIILKRTSS